MFKEGVRDILEKLDDDLVGLIPVKLRVRQIAALLVLDKVRHRSAVHQTDNFRLVNMVSSKIEEPCAQVSFPLTPLDQAPMTVFRRGTFGIDGVDKFAHRHTSLLCSLNSFVSG